MKYTVITATYNSEKTLSKTFDSILNQTYNNFEYIVIDGKSNDKTLEIIKSYEKKFNSTEIKFKWISESDTGIYNAWNKGLKLASGNWISFLGSDDIYLNDAIQSYEALIGSQTKDVDLVYSAVDVVKSNKLIRKINGLWSWNIFKRKMNIAHVGAFHNKNYFEKYGVFDDGYKIAGDYELLLRAKQNLKTLKLDKTTALMAHGGVSNNQIFKVFSETIQAKNKTGELSLLLCYLDFCKAYLIYFAKKILRYK